jgi:multiple sugar transport system substrate-binding protein
MKRSLRLRAGVAVLTIGAVVLAGCTGGADGGDENGPLTVWLPPVGADKAIAQQLEDFTDKTGIEVNVEPQNWENYFQNLTTALTTGEGPDVAAIGNTWTASLGPIGGLMQFDDAAFDQFGGEDRFLAAPLTSTAAPGETPVAVPWMAYAYGLIYSKSAFAAAGISDPPATWDEFRADGELLSRDGTYGTSYTGASTTGPNTTLLWAIIRQHGGELFADDGTPTFTDPDVEAAVADYLSWLNEGIANPASAEYAESEAVEDLAKGTVGMVVVQNNLVASAVAAGMDRDDIGVAPTPIVDGGEVVRSHVAGINLVVFDNSAHKEDALKLVDYLISTRSQVEVNKAANSLPVVDEAYDDPAFSTPANEVFGTTVAEESEPLPMVPQQGQMQTILGAAINQLIAQAASGDDVSDADIHAALDDANQQMAALG